MWRIILSLNTETKHTPPLVEVYFSLLLLQMLEMAMKRPYYFQCQFDNSLHLCSLQHQLLCHSLLGYTKQQFMTHIIILLKIAIVT